MSDLVMHEKVCAVCGALSEQPSLCSGHSEGAPDLDGRPAEPLRSTMASWLETCPNCGYTRGDIEQRCRLSRQRLSAGYARIEQHEKLPETQSFLRYAYYLAERGESYRAARQLLCAAWVLDDRGETDKAAAMRGEAIRQLDRALRRPRRGQRAKIHCLRADLLRRCGRFEETAALAADSRVQRRLNDEERRLLALQAKLALAGDSDVHTAAEL